MEEKEKNELLLEISKQRKKVKIWTALTIFFIVGTVGTSIFVGILMTKLNNANTADDIVKSEPSASKQEKIDPEEETATAEIVEAIDTTTLQDYAYIRRFGYRINFKSEDIRYVNLGYKEIKEQSLCGAILEISAAPKDENLQTTPKFSYSVMATLKFFTPDAYEIYKAAGGGGVGSNDQVVLMAEDMVVVYDHPQSIEGVETDEEKRLFNKANGAIEAIVKDATAYEKIGSYKN